MLILMIIILTIVIPKLLIKLDLWLAIINASNTKHIKNIDQELLPVSRHPTGAQDWCMWQDKKKKWSHF